MCFHEGGNSVQLDAAEATAILHPYGIVAYVKQTRCEKPRTPRVRGVSHIKQVDPAPAAVRRCAFPGLPRPAGRDSPGRAA